MNKLHGAGGGGGPHYTKDNLFSRDFVEVVLGISKGPIRGPVDGAKNLFAGDTAVVNQSGEANFKNFSIFFYPGESEPAAVDFSLGGETSSISTGLPVQLKQNITVTRTTPSVLRRSNGGPGIDFLEFRLLFATLYRTNDKGSTYEHTAHFLLEYKPSGSSVWASHPTKSLSGKTTSGYSRDFSIKIDPTIDDDWDVRVTKKSPDDQKNEFCEISWESLQMTTQRVRKYPNLALLHIKAQASSQFSSVPTFTGVYDGLLLQVPSNYNPDTRTYSNNGVWNGLFSSQLQWTNNPAWVLYALIMNPDWGLIKYYPHITVNKFEFYEAAQWCDEMVPNGKYDIGGNPLKQPRFTFNDYITEQRSGLETLQYVAGSFNAAIFDDANGVIHLRVDKWTEPVIMFTPESVSTEGFNYTFTDITTRYNDITVSYINPDTEWSEDRRRVYDKDLIDKFGRIPLDFVAVGCTDTHEAVRRATHRLITVNSETCTVSFTTNRLGMVVDPFSPIWIADPDSGWSSGGRILGIEDNMIYLRDPIYVESVKFLQLKIQTTTGISEVTVSTVTAGNIYELKVVDGTLPSNIPDFAPFTVEDSANIGYAKPFRVMGINEVDGNPNQYTITALEINRDKYEGSDNATPMYGEQYSFRNGTPLKPVNLRAESGTAHLILSTTGSLISRIYVQWERPRYSNTSKYIIDYQEDETGVWESKETTSFDFYISPVNDGKVYNIRITPLSPTGTKGPVAELSHTAVGKTEPPSSVTGFTITKRPTDLLLQWEPVSDIDLRGYEIRLGNSWDDGEILVTNLQATYFVHDQEFAGTYHYMIRAKDWSDRYSPVYGEVNLVLVGPSTVQGFDCVQFDNRIEFRWKANPEKTITGYQIREGNSWNVGKLVTEVSATSYSMAVSSFMNVRTFWIKAIDAPGIEGTTAAFCLLDPTPSVDRNVVVEVNESETGWLGAKYNVSVVAGDLVLEEGEQRGEYIFGVTLPKTFKARNSIISTVDAVMLDDLTWATANFAWNSPQTNRPWIISGDSSLVNVDYFISTYEGLGGGYVESFPLDGTTTGLLGATASESTNVTYDEGRFTKGVYVDLNTKLSWVVNIPEVFSTTFWVIPKAVAGDRVWWTAKTAGNKTLKVIAGDDSVKVESSTGEIISTPFTAAVGDRVLVGVSQTLTERKLFIGNLTDGIVHSVAGNFAPLGAFTKLQLY